MSPAASGFQHSLGAASTGFQKGPISTFRGRHTSRVCTVYRLPRCRPLRPRRELEMESAVHQSPSGRALRTISEDTLSPPIVVGKGLFSNTRCRPCPPPSRPVQWHREMGSFLRSGMFVLCDAVLRNLHAPCKGRNKSASNRLSEWAAT